MAGMDYCLSDATCNYYYYPPAQAWPVQWLDEAFRKFLNLFDPINLDVNPLPIIMRAVNALGLRGIIKQPCWRSGRWRSKT